MKLDKNYVIAYWITFSTYIIAFVVMMLTIGYDYNAPLSNVWIKRCGGLIMLFGWAVWYMGRKKLGHESIDIDPLGELARIILHPKRKRVRKPPEKIIDTGIYSITRHPQYWGTILFYIGISIALECIPGLITALVIVLPAHIWRAKVEEKMMLKMFGDKYRKYMERIKI